MTQKPFTPAEIAAAESAVLQDSLKQLARLREILEPLRAMEGLDEPAPWKTLYVNSGTNKMLIAARNAIAEMLRVTGGKS
jgi:hypothetical protein